MSVTSIIVLISIACACGIIIGYYAKNFFNNSKENQIAIVKQWLLFAVAQAEKELGSKTGDLKLAKVYNEFVNELPVAAKVINYDEFKELVDFALKQLNIIMTNSKEITNYVKGN